MKRYYLTTAVILTLASSVMFSSCIGSFALTNKVLAWNKQVGSKFVNELVFAGLWILPVYELTAIADMLVINSIEFWSGSNPVMASTTRTIDGKNARYLVKSDPTGYTITNTADKTVTRFNFDAADNSWSVVDQNGNNVKFMQFVDDNHVKMLTPNGDFQSVELNAQGVWAYEQLVQNHSPLAMR